ncbi:glycosyltransferase [Arcicella rosea]|uniref:Glycosyltransferase involved in cell wall biosynthesis n=1 Tax=Arcicella rosea TaxID=502909 RepID=A0A841ENH1_9BACT|nr:glycosyltransferase [Arcicella rosea]MBB6004456.1 glycosyltransferase involved in cell wall biosynthesis [Arcicella rosea]
MFASKTSNKIIKVLHIATGNYSPRVIKEVSTLSEDYEVYVIQAVRLDDDEPKAHFYHINYYPQLWKRICFNFPKILFWYFKVRPKIVHIHVIELIPIAYLFSLLKTKIIFDIYEDFHKKLPTKLKSKILISLFSYFDKLASKHFNLIFAENTYLTSYLNIRKNHEVILNYPRKDDFEFIHFQFNILEPEIFYIGQISVNRCIEQLLESIYLLKKLYPNIKLNLFGYFSSNDFPKKLEVLIKEYDLEGNILVYGMTSFKEAAEIAKNAFVGIALLKDIGDYSISYPTKMFEYMASGLPVITSNFEHCLSVINSTKSGFSVNPESTQEIFEAIHWFIQNPKEAKEMGNLGKEAIRKQYNWESEAKKLVEFYHKVLID